MHLVIILLLVIMLGFIVWLVYRKIDNKKDNTKNKKVTFNPDLNKEYYENFNEYVNDSVIKYVNKILPYDLNAPKSYQITMNDVPPFEQPIQELKFNADYKSTLKQGCNYM